jgi:PTH2 family peptidyl-tRNA hydrolase
MSEDITPGQPEPDDAPENIEFEIRGDETVHILTNRNVTMSPGKLAAQAVHAALMAYGIPHGAVIVLNGSPNQIRAMDAQVEDAGRTEIAPGTLTAGASLE